ncbi:conserved hypothetical protein [Histoplasma capsulatum G186AR]|uniref:Uncharacterized protein n=2 Tax=Ajellomyces capsulatus TaxID=5037 RepID=C0P134_AJECG|nr:uncharacterized protein HCBG_09114 [Histoplasma capsulatum G186AR]EEH02670.1 conserved hypothetical protein [Histoplasma capsulatum G186AR]KAG5288405.1 hypothetical protein I7I52_11880 [Histoplasma capsulatum]QSS70981.1 hypothetical protein I7I50_01664 [Histoplasma capsulatum G186AR]
MSSSVLHHCTYCGHDSEISNSLAAFAENPYCRQCGLSAAEGDSKMQDDLAILFARQMSVAGIPSPNQKLASPPQSMVPAVMSPTPDMSPSPPPTPSPSISRPIAYNISQHYHHSAHQLPGSGGWSKTLSATLHDMQQAGISAEEILFQNNVDPTALFPSQLTLFAHADVEQKTRLIELWQISRPSVRKANPFDSCSGSGGSVIPTSSSSLPSRMQSARDTMIDVDCMDQDARSTTGLDDSQHAEPYVMSGYEALAQREYDTSAARSACGHGFAEASQSSVAAAATTSTSSSYKPAVDPVYKGNGLWDAHGQQQGHGQGGSEAVLLLQPMENQYGAFEQRNNSMYLGCGIARAHWLDDREML